MARALIADTSHYSGFVTPQRLRGFSMVIAKGGGNENAADISPYDAQFAQTVEAAYQVTHEDGNRGIPCGMYWFLAPRVWIERGVTPLSEHLARIRNEDHLVLKQIEHQLRAGTSGWKAVSSIWFDIEEASLWLAPGLGKVTSVHLRAMLDDLTGRISALSTAGYWPKYRLGVYSRKSWMDAFDDGRQIRTWLENHPEIAIWTADYRVRSMPAYQSGLDIAGEPAPLQNGIPAAFGWSARRTHAWDIWQFWGKGWADLNLFRGTQAELYAWLGYQPRPAPATPDLVADDLLSDLSRHLQTIQIELQAMQTRLAEVKNGN